MAYKRISPQPIIEGGTGATTYTVDGVIYYNGSILASTAVGTSGQVLTSNGTGVAPTFQPGGGTPLAATCSFFASSVGQISLGSGSFDCTFTNTVINNGSVYDGNKLFTAPTNGLYTFTTQVAPAGGSGTVGDYIGFTHNSTAYSAALNQQTTSGTISICTTTSIIISLTAGDTMKVYYHALGSPTQLSGNIAGLIAVYFMGYQIA